MLKPTMGTSVQVTPFVRVDNKHILPQTADNDCNIGCKSAGRSRTKARQEKTATSLCSYLDAEREEDLYVPASQPPLRLTHPCYHTVLLHEMLDLSGLHEGRDAAQVHHSTLGQPLVVVLDLPLAEWFERALHLSLLLRRGVRLPRPVRRSLQGLRWDAMITAGVLDLLVSNSLHSTYTNAPLAFGLLGLRSSVTSPVTGLSNKLAI